MNISVGDEVRIDTHASTLLHYTDEPFEFDFDRQYDPGKELGFGKPAGLWVSVQGEMDWEQWCRSVEFGISTLQVVYEIKLTDDANILWLSNPDDIIEFHKVYSVEYLITHRLGDNAWRFNHRKIDWSKVAEGYDGIIIAPYQWSLRFNGPFWYYGWDCASGVIWNTKAIAFVEKVTEVAMS